MSDKIKKFKAPGDGRSYSLTKGGILEKINGQPVSNADRKMFIDLGYAVISPKKATKGKEINDA